MQKIYITWANGYIWSHIREYLSWEYEIIKSSVDIRNLDVLTHEIMEVKPDIIINAAWKTWKPNVDWCEDNKEETMTVNVSWAINVASAASILWIYCVHIGSWCVYQWDNDGKWFSEKDKPNFYGSYYSRTKIISENALKEFPILQLRIRIPTEWKSIAKNVINKLVKYDKIISIENSFTIIEDFLPTMKHMIEDRATWVYNMCNIGSCDHEFIMKNYQEIVDPSFSFEIMSLDELDSITKAKRSNCVLSSNKREGAGYNMPSIMDRIPEIMEAYRESMTGES